MDSKIVNVPTKHFIPYLYNLPPPSVLSIFFSSSPWTEPLLKKENIKKKEKGNFNQKAERRVRYHKESNQESIK